MCFPVRNQKTSSFRMLHVQRIFLYVSFSFCLPSSGFFSSAFSRDSGGIALCSLSGSTVRRRRAAGFPRRPALRRACAWFDSAVASVEILNF